jgi:hypothetical protein
MIQIRLERLLADRLLAEGIRVNPTSTKRLIVSYKESSGRKSQTLKYLDKNGNVQTQKFDNPFDTVTAEVSVRWSNDNWNARFSETENLNTEDQLKGADPSKVFAAGLLESAAGSLSGMMFPYFIAETPLDGNVQLPLWFEKMDAPTAAAQPPEEPDVKF